MPSVSTLVLGLSAAWRPCPVREPASLAHGKGSCAVLFLKIKQLPTDECAVLVFWLKLSLPSFPRFPLLLLFQACANAFGLDFSAQAFRGVAALSRS
eukprot:7506077-Pyramimonas_sp.AAC.1